jgi:hypothetical protein
MVPVFWTTAVYALFAPTMHLTLYKYPLSGIVLLISLILSLRVRGTVVFNWLLILVAYRFRPKTYVFNKNDAYMRTVDVIPIDTKPVTRKAKSVNKSPSETLVQVSIGEYTQLERLIRDKRLAISYRTNGKGGLNVAFSQAR